MTIDELRPFGVRRMDDREIQGFLSTQRVGVLGLSGDSDPYLVPLSYGYDGEEALYLTYVLGPSSRKASLTDRSDGASFLVYSAETPYNWESAALTGSLDEVPERDWDAVRDVLAATWRPAVFESAEPSTDVRIYRFAIESRSGIKHTGLPAGFREDADDDADRDPDR